MSAGHSRPARIRRRVTVRGEVQGVFFRDATATEARRHHVAGWVRNCEDGSLEAVLEGEPDGVGAVLEFCREGPEQALVRDIEVVEQEPSGLEDFVVR